MIREYANCRKTFPLFKELLLIAGIICDDCENCKMSPNYKIYIHLSFTRIYSC